MNQDVYLTSHTQKINLSDLWQFSIHRLVDQFE